MNLFITLGASPCSPMDLFQQLHIPLLRLPELDTELQVRSRGSGSHPWTCWCHCFCCITALCCSWLQQKVIKARPRAGRSEHTKGSLILLLIPDCPQTSLCPSLCPSHVLSAAPGAQRCFGCSPGTRRFFLKGALFPPCRHHSPACLFFFPNLFFSLSEFHAGTSYLQVII